MLIIWPVKSNSADVLYFCFNWHLTKGIINKSFTLKLG